MDDDDSFLLTLCRTCLMDVSTTECESIFSNNNCLLLQECLSIQVKEDDNLPAKLCKQCAQQLNVFKQFRQQAWDNNNTLEKFSRGEYTSKQLLRIIQSRDFDDGKHDKIDDFPDFFGTYEDIKVEVDEKMDTKEEKKIKIKRKSTKKKVDPQKESKAKRKRKSSSSSDDLPLKSVKVAELPQDELSKLIKNGLTCHVCYKQYARKSSLKLHLATHMNNSAECQQCNKKFSNKHSLYKHVKLHGEPTLACPQQGCTKKYHFMSRLVEHVVSCHKLKKQFVCEHCSERFYLKEQLDKHMKDNYYRHIALLNKDKHACPMEDCSEKSYALAILANHVRDTHGGEARYTCCYCGAKFILQQQNERHSALCAVRHAQLQKIDYTCTKRECGKVFVHLHQLTRHLEEEHAWSKQLQCKWCNEKFFVKIELERHEEEEKHDACLDSLAPILPYMGEIKDTDPKSEDFYYRNLMRANKQPYKCPQVDCSKKYYSLYHLAMHVRRMHSSYRSYECQHCKCSFYLTLQLDKHERYCAIRHQNTACKMMYICPGADCAAGFDELHLLTTHMQRKCHIPKNIDCKWCGAMFCLEIELERHTEEEEHEQFEDVAGEGFGPNGVLCKQCGVYVKEFNKHMLEHERKMDKEISCKYCNEKFATRQVLRNHVSRQHRKRPMCHLCGKRYSNLQHMRRHMLTEEKTEADTCEPTSMRTFICKVCTKSFDSKSKLSNHMNFVHYPKMVACKICGHTFKQKQYQQHLIRVHLNVRNYACKYCEYKGKSAANLKAHTLIHTDERPHACPHCPQAFRDRKVLKHHVMRHTGERPYACNLCDKRFIQRTAWLTHMKTHNEHKGGACFVCTLCHMSFNHSSGLAAHKNTHLTPAPIQGY